MLEKYTKKPDGEDCARKAYICGKVGFKLGTFFAITHVTLVSKPTTISGVLFGLSRIVLPCTIAGLSYAGVVCAATNLRKKDDLLNHALGGASVAVITTAKMRQPGVTAVLALACAFGGCLVKDSWQSDWTFGLHTTYGSFKMFEKKVFIKKRPEAVEDSA